MEVKEKIKLSDTSKEDAEKLIRKFPDLEIHEEEGNDIVEIWGPEDYLK